MTLLVDGIRPLLTLDPRNTGLDLTQHTGYEPYLTAKLANGRHLK